MLFGVVFEAGTHVSCPDWPQICYIVKDDLKFLISCFYLPKTATFATTLISNVIEILHLVPSSIYTLLKEILNRIIRFFPLPFRFMKTNLKNGTDSNSANFLKAAEATLANLS